MTAVQNLLNWLLAPFQTLPHQNLIRKMNMSVATTYCNSFLTNTVIEMFRNTDTYDF